jgi:ribosomal protein S18 acetylase RimI-like enzyme
MTSADTMRVRRAELHDSDITLVTGILTEAFFRGDLAGWLVPDETLRARIYPPYFRLLAAHAIENGHVEVLGADATAVWYDLGRGPAPAIAGYDAQLAEITGTRLFQFRQLDHAMHQNHPSWQQTPHAYLGFLAVRPGSQGQGLGAALLEHRLTDLDRHQRPAYLEATGSRNRALYQRHGYQPRDPYEIVAGGPRLYPMWRHPSS